VCRAHHADFGCGNGHRGSAKKAATPVVYNFGHSDFSLNFGVDPVPEQADAPDQWRREWQSEDRRAFRRPGFILQIALIFAADTLC